MNNIPVVPEFSVIIPTYNLGRYLAEAIQSVYDDKWDSFEIVVVDDGSTDDTSDIVKEFPDIRYHHQSNQGVAAARNTGISLAKGHIIVFLDSDDIWLPGRFKRTSEYLKKHPEVDYLLGYQKMFLEPGFSRPGHIKEEWLTMDTEAYGTCTMAARKDCFDKVGSFNISYKTGEDSEWMLRASENHLNMAWIETPVIKRRIHPDNLSETDPVKRKMATIKMIRESLKRKRQSNEK